jgi:hypothetical protein
MRTLVLAAIAGATLLTLPALADEGAGTGRANFYLELARDQARLQNGRAPGVLPAQTGTVDAYARSRPPIRHPAQPRR